MVMNIYYHAETGHIHSYQGGGHMSPADEIPAGCKRVAFMEDQSITDSKTFRINKKIDVKTKQLIPLIDQKPITEENEVEELQLELSVKERDLLQALKEESTDFATALKTQIADIKIRLDSAQVKRGTITVVE